MGSPYNQQKLSKPMKILSNLIIGDIRQIFRDKTLTFFLFSPIILILFIRLFVPFITDRFPEIAQYHSNILMFAGIQTAIMFGFITSFIILDEKDENVLQVIRVLPISPSLFILYRLTFATLISGFGAFLMLNYGGIAYPGFVNSILLSIQYGLTAPFITLVVATFARNKVEGMAYFKGLDLILLLPMMAFFIEGNIKYIFALVPSFWTFSLFQKSMEIGSNYLFFLAGLVFYAMSISLFFSQFKKRVFDR
jgi:hypothetical protein